MRAREIFKKRVFGFACIKWKGSKTFQISVHGMDCVKTQTNTKERFESGRTDARVQREKEEEVHVGGID